MNIEALLYFIVLILGAIIYLFSGLNRLRSINNDSFITSTSRKYLIKGNDKLQENQYKKFILIINIITAVLLLTTAILSYLELGGSISNLSALELQVITIGANAAALIFLTRINIVDLLVERFIQRENNPLQHIQIGFLVLNLVVFAAFVYNIFTY